VLILMDINIYLGFCATENLTTATFVSLVSIRTLNEKTMALDHLSCGTLIYWFGKKIRILFIEDVDHNNFLSKIDDDLVSYGNLDLITIDPDSAISDNEKLIPMTGKYVVLVFLQDFLSFIYQIRIQIALKKGKK
jgi:hypothetical protein